MRYKIEFLLVRYLLFISKYIDLRYLKYASFILKYLIQHIFHYRRKVVRINLRNSFPQLTAQHRRKIENKFYLHMAMLTLELIKSSREDKNFFHKHINYHNENLLKDAYEKGNGVILISGHLGIYEWIVQILPILSYKTMAVMKRIKNHYINDFIYDIRSRFGAEIVYVSQATKTGMKTLKNGHILGIVADQDAGRSGVFVNFLNMPASTARGTALFHHKLKSPIIFAALIRRKWGSYDLFFEEIKNNASDSDPVSAFTQAHMNMLEKYVKKYPEQYLWSHKRWKTQPNGSSPYKS